MADDVDLRLHSEKLKGFMERCLTERERTVIALRYGLITGEELPQRETARLLGISRSYVSRIEKKALEKLRDEYEGIPGKG